MSRTSRAKQRKTRELQHRVEVLEIQRTRALGIARDVIQPGLSYPGAWKHIAQEIVDALTEYP